MALLALGLPVVLASAANAVPLESVQSSSQEHWSDVVQIAQAPNSCYQVIAQAGMYVQAEPTIFSESLDILLFGEQVLIAPGSTEDWLSISAPTPGYVWADWLVPC